MKLVVSRGQDVTVEVRFRNSEAANAAGHTPQVERVDLITGDVTGPARDRNTDGNPSTRVVARFADEQWTRRGDLYSISTTISGVAGSMYVRIRGMNTQDAEPATDTPGERPWQDLWFYSNPVFIEVK